MLIEESKRASQDGGREAYYTLKSHGSSFEISAKIKDEMLKQLFITYLTGKHVKGNANQVKQFRVVIECVCLFACLFFKIP